MPLLVPPSPPSLPVLTQQDLGDGRYNVVYRLTKAGDYDVHVEGPEAATGEGEFTVGEKGRKECWEVWRLVRLGMRQIEGVIIIHKTSLPEPLYTQLICR